ncbi:MAG: hypothetical protein ACP5K1_01150, partial [Candidatus Bathyarchaeia archaeon]
MSLIFLSVITLLNLRGYVKWGCPWPSPFTKDSARKPGTLVLGWTADKSLNVILIIKVLSESLMKARKTIKAKILELRKGKEELLKHECENWQRYLRGDETAPLYSATRQQVERFLRRLRKQNGGRIDQTKEYPLIFRNDVYDIRKEDTKLTPYWIRIPVAGKRGGINCPIALSSPIPDGAKTREAKIIRRGDEWYAYITIQKEVEER